MHKSSWQHILKIFYEYSVEVLIYIEKGKFKGIIAKQDIVEALSDIDVIRSDEDEIPLREVDSIETLLELHQKFHCLDDDKNKVLPVVNRNKEFVGLWGRSQILKAYESLPSISAWQPEVVSRQQKELEEPRSLKVDITRLAEDLKKAPAPRVPSKVKIHFNSDMISIENKENETVLESKQTDTVEKQVESDIPDFSINSQKTRLSKALETHLKKKPDLSRAVQPKQGRQNDSDKHDQGSELIPKWKVQIENSKLAILTIETLPIPLMAADTKGNELYYNRDWENLVKIHRHQLNTGYLVEFAKDVMADKALKGNLDPDDTLALDVLKKQGLSMRLMRQTIEGQSKAVGYLFWVNESPSERRVRPSELISKRSTDSAFSTLSKTPSIEKEATSFLGRTLPDILADQEKKAIEWAMDEADGNQSNAAMLLGIPRQTLSYKMQKYFKQHRV